MRNLVLIATAAVVLSACSQKDDSKKSETPPAPINTTPAANAPPPADVPPPIVPAKTDAPAGVYHLDKAHASLNFRVTHLGMSHYTARFTRFDATLTLDPLMPANSQLTATVDPHSLQTNYPDPEKLNFDAEIAGPQWLDAAKFPEITYRATKIELTGPTTAQITGDLTFHGITQPLVLEATYNNAYASQPMDPAGSRIGFSAHGGLKRSDFNMTTGIPQPGSDMGVSDGVEIVIEAEFTKPADTPPAK